MVDFPNAKINLGLNIIQKRIDGYHDIETVFVPVSLYDALEIVPSEEFGFTFSGIEIDSSKEDNLVVKAYRLIRRYYSIPTVAIHLHKKIPIGAGLGGGSSDAVMTLKMLNLLFNLGINQERMLELSRELCSDCPFFVLNRPVYAYERGDKFREINLDLREYKILLIYPDIKISSAFAYSLVKPQKPSYSLQRAVQEPIERWPGVIKNDFEPIIFERYSIIGQLKDALYNLGAYYALVSGSGSVVYGIFSSDMSLPEEVLGFRAYIVEVI